jgi:hypothetical protein
VIFSVGLITRLYYLPFDIPIVLDGASYFWYANDMSILGQIPSEYKPHNNLWSSILSIFFTVNSSNEILNYMNIQRILSSVISSLTVFPIFFLCKRFFSNKYALIGSLFFVLDPRIIMNSLLGITEPIYLLIGIIIILFSFYKNEKLQYLSFGLAAVLTLIRYEGLLIFIPLTISFFWKFRINKKSILKYVLCIIIFILVLLPMVETRIQATGQDGIISHIFSGTNYVSNTLSGTYEKQDRGEFLKDGITNSIIFLGWITIPIWIIFLPYGIWKYFKKLDFQKSTLLLFSIVLILPAIYAYARDIPETRYLYILFPLFSIISLYSIERISKNGNWKMIFGVIVIGIIVGSVGWMEYKWINTEYEKQAFELSFKIKELTNGVNEFYPESAYLNFINLNDKFPKLKNEIKEKHKIFSLNNYEKVEDLILNERSNGLTHIVADNSQNVKNQRPEFLVNIYENEYKYGFLKKIYDSKDDEFTYHLKIFEINYELFDEYIKDNNQELIKN